MKVINRINNNVVLVHDDKNKMIVTGRGLGFKVYPGDEINEKFIEQRFILQDNTNDNYYIQLLKEIPMEYLAISKKIVELAEQQLNYHFSLNLILSLADHLYFAVERYQKGMSITHPLSWEIKQFFTKEMAFASNALDIFNNELKVEIPEEEAVFIAMHIINSTGGLGSQYNVEDLTDMMIQIIQIIENEMDVQIDQKTASFSRFITHLRYYLIRQLNFEIDNSINEELMELVEEKYPHASKCARLIQEYLQNKYGNETSESETLYLTLHINRLINKE